MSSPRKLERRFIILALSISLFLITNLKDRPAEAQPPSTHAQHDLSHKPPLPSAEQRCSGVFSAATSRMPWESPEVAPPTSCLRSRLDDDQLSVCLGRRSGVLQRPLHIVLIGDSRARNVFLTLQKRLNLHQWAGKSLHETFPGVSNASILLVGPANGCTEGFWLYSQMTGKLKKVACSFSVTGRLAKVDFFWRTEMSQNTLDKLDELNNDCRTGSCPDLVLLQMGMWYATPFAVKREKTRYHKVLYMRSHGLALAEKIAALSRHTKVVYRVNGPVMARSRKEGNTKVGSIIVAINALVLELLQKGGTAQPYTSALSEILHFYHTVCLSHTSATGNNIHPPAAVDPRCVDTIHEGDSVRSSTTDNILSYICSGYLQRKPGQCCGY